MDINDKNCQNKTVSKMCIVAPSTSPFRHFRFFIFFIYVQIFDKKKTQNGQINRQKPHFQHTQQNNFDFVVLIKKSISRLRKERHGGYWRRVCIRQAASFRAHKNSLKVFKRQNLLRGGGAKNHINTQTTGYY